MSAMGNDRRVDRPPDESGVGRGGTGGFASGTACCTETARLIVRSRINGGALSLFVGARVLIGVTRGDSECPLSFALRRGLFAGGGGEGEGLPLDSRAGGRGLSDGLSKASFVEMSGTAETDQQLVLLVAGEEGDLTFAFRPVVTPYSGERFRCAQHVLKLANDGL